MDVLIRAVFFGLRGYTASNDPANLMEVYCAGIVTLGGLSPPCDTEATPRSGGISCVRWSGAVRGSGATPRRSPGAEPLPQCEDAPNLAAAGDTVVFSGYSVLTGGELWKRDGSSEGTALLKEVYPGPD